MVLATAVPKKKAAMKFQKAAHATAVKGLRTRVETTVAMELAASCQPLENSKTRVRRTTARSRGGIAEMRARICGSMDDDYALFRMTPSMTLATSSHLSTAVSMTS